MRATFCARCRLALACCRASDWRLASVTSRAMANIMRSRADHTADHCMDTTRPSLRTTRLRKSTVGRPARIAAPSRRVWARSSGCARSKCARPTSSPGEKPHTDSEALDTWVKRPLASSTQITSSEFSSTRRFITSDCSSRRESSRSAFSACCWSVVSWIAPEAATGSPAALRTRVPSSRTCRVSPSGCRMRYSISRSPASPASNRCRASSRRFLSSKCTRLSSSGKLRMAWPGPRPKIEFASCDRRSSPEARSCSQLPRRAMRWARSEAAVACSAAASARLRSEMSWK